MAVVALGLSAMLLADSFAVVPGHAVDAAAGARQGDDASDTADALVCSSGFGDIRTKTDMSLHGVALTNRGAIAVGFTRRRQPSDLGHRRTAAIYNSAGRWLRTYTGSPGDEDGLVAVAAGRRNDAWAVGFTTIEGQVMPLAMRWNGRGWDTKRPRRRGSMTSMFTDVAVLGTDGVPFAVGYRMTASGKRQPIAARRDGKTWRFLNPRAGRRESISLTGVTRDRKGGLWAVGHGGRGAEIGPVIYRRHDARWTRRKTPRIRGEGVLADVVATSGKDAWAVGYQRHKGRSVPLVLHYDGKGWQRAVGPRFDSDDVVLTAVSAASGGGIWVVGAAWNAAIRSHEAVAAWWDGQAWNEVAGIDGGTELHDVAGSLDADGWAVGRSGQKARATRVCTPPQAGIFDGSEPTAPDEPIQPVDELTASSTDTDQLEASAAGSADEAAAVTTLVAAKKNNKSKKSKRRRTGTGGLPAPRVHASVRARNVARQAGIAGSASTYGAVVADFDGDGTEDLFIGRHGRKGRLLLNRDGRFVNHEPMSFPAIDRHGCTAADIDGSGLPDLYCAIGGKRGSGLKSNELWIDPGGPAPYDAAVSLGLSDPTGRGRDAEFLESERNATVSLVVTNSPTRVDGLPSIGRLFRTRGDGEFVARTRTGFAPRLGSLTTQDADFDNDGREDLLLVTGGLQAPRQQGTRLYRNTRRGLVDVTREMGIRSFGEIEAKLADINGDKKLDLVQLSPTRIRVSLLRNGRFQQVYQRKLTYGRAIGVGDINGDRRDDLYIVRSNGSRNPPDVMLVNHRNGRFFSSLSIPQVYSGDGDAAIAIDHDGNGLDDFVVLNGRNERGPIELIAFYRR